MAAAALPSILYVTDLSDSSLNALEWAIKEALKHNLNVSVLYPYRLDQVRKKDNVVQSMRQMEAEALDKFEHQAAGLLRSSHLTFDFRSEVGFLRDRIAEHARNHNVVMLVMGNRMALVDSFPELIEEIEIPVVIVPSGKE